MDAERGQSSVEFLAVLPAILLVMAATWELAVAGHTAWLTANAARVAARAQAVGKDPIEAARSALPRRLEDHLEVEPADRAERNAKVMVRVRIPLLVGNWTSPVTVRAAAEMKRQVP